MRPQKRRDAGEVRKRIDGRTDQHERRWRSRIVIAGEECGGGKGWHAALAKRDHVQAWRQGSYRVQEIGNIGVEAE